MMACVRRVSDGEPAGVKLVLGTAVAASLLAGAAAVAGVETDAGPQPSAKAAVVETTASRGAGTEHSSPPEGYPSLGPASARNTLVFFTDYQCPVCPRAARELERLVADFGGALRVELHHHPLAMHPNAFEAAMAAKAAQRQGRFWEYHAALLNSRQLDRATLVGLAVESGLDRDLFVRDLDDPNLRRQVADEGREAETVHAAGTPAFVILGHVEVGWASLAWLEQIVRAHSR